MRIELAFHKGKPFGKKGWFIGAISKFFTRGKFAHVELVFPKEIAGSDNSFSSRGMGSKGKGRKPGVSFQNISYSHMSRWIWYDIDLPRESVWQVYSEAVLLKGKKYDYLTVLARYGLGNKKINVKKRWYCSEAIAYILGINPYNISPTTLYNVIKERYPNVQD